MSEGWAVDCAMNYNTTKAVFHEVNRYMLECYNDVNGVDFTKNIIISLKRNVYRPRYADRVNIWRFKNE